MSGPLDVVPDDVTDATGTGATKTQQASDEVKTKGDKTRTRDDAVRNAIKRVVDRAGTSLDSSTRTMDTANTAGRTLDANNGINTVRAQNLTTPGLNITGTPQMSAPMQFGQAAGQLVSTLGNTAMTAAPTMVQAAAPMTTPMSTAPSIPAGTVALSPQQLAALAALDSGSDTGSTGDSPMPTGKGKLNDLIAKIIAAKTPYAWGGGSLEGPTTGISDGGGAADANGDYNKIGYDCSGLVRYLYYQDTGIEIPRTSEAQYSASTPVTDPKPGDLVFPQSAGRPPGHVQMYIGDGKVVQAPQSGDYVRIDNLESGAEIRRPGRAA